MKSSKTSLNSTKLDEFIRDPLRISLPIISNISKLINFYFPGNYQKTSGRIETNPFALSHLKIGSEFQGQSFRKKNIECQLK